MVQNNCRIRIIAAFCEKVKNNCRGNYMVKYCTSLLFFWSSAIVFSLSNFSYDETLKNFFKSYENTAIECRASVIYINERNKTFFLGLLCFVSAFLRNLPKTRKYFLKYNTLVGGKFSCPRQPVRYSFLCESFSRKGIFFMIGSEKNKVIGL